MTRLVITNESTNDEIVYNRASLTGMLKFINTTKFLSHINKVNERNDRCVKLL